jgi:hypothetical protein
MPAWVWRVEHPRCRKQSREVTTSALGNAVLVLAVARDAFVRSILVYGRTLPAMRAPIFIEGEASPARGTSILVEGGATWALSATRLASCPTLPVRRRMIFVGRVLPPHGGSLSWLQIEKEL